MKIQKLLIILIIISSIFSCHKNSDDVNIIDGELPNPIILNEKIGTIYGYVYNSGPDAFPERNITVTLPTGETTLTNEFGVFVFKNVKLDPHGTYIQAGREKGWRFMGSDYVYPTSGTVYSYIQLLNSKTLDGKFQASQGATININGGGSILFAPNSIKDENGNDYQGDVTVYAKRLSTDDKKLGDKMPGELRGTRINGNTVVLSSFGMVAVLLFDDARNPLNLKASTTAKLTSPITNAQLNDAPDEIPMWYFDEDNGIWIEEGTAQKVGNNYEADIAHFSWWNCDAPFPVVNLCVKVKYSDDTPASNFEVQIASSINTGRNGYTGSEGEICGKIAKNTALTLTVLDPKCGEILKTIKIGPFENDVVLDDIILDIASPLGIGNVQCNGETVKDAVIVVKYTTTDGNGTHIIAADENGNYNLNINNSVCDDLTSVELFGYSISTGDASPALPIDLNDIQNLDLNICTDCEFTALIVPLEDANCPNEITQLTATSSASGNYSYAWSTGETTANINSQGSNTYCVTITDLDGNCSKINCYEIDESDYFHVDILPRNSSCGLDNGSIGLEVWGGTPPYTMTWSNGQVGQFLDNLSSGTYSVTVSDFTGCFKIVEVLIEDTTIEIVLQSYSECNNASLSVNVQNNNSQDVTYQWSDGSTASRIIVYDQNEYCVTVTVGNCEVSDCITSVILPAQIPQLTGCNDSLYMYFGTDPFQISISDTLQSNNLTVNDQFDINVLTYGYKFIAFGECIGQNTIILPNYKGNTYTEINNTTCGSCDDGYVLLVSNLTSECYECTVGEIKIYNENDLSTDLSTLNASQQLPKGAYYIVLKDATSNCWIAHDKINIQ